MITIKQEVTDRDLSDFTGYLLSFYGPGGVYDMGVTTDHAKAALQSYLTRMKPFLADSTDRELVRDVLTKEYGYKMPEPRKG